MPNTWFQFKQFKIEQEKSAMKVTTDACLFGAWMADKIEKKIIQPASILDIGSGTGLLSLMVAQKSSSEIDAIEIDEKAYLQTKQNFTESKYSNRLRAFIADVKDWDSGKKYDLIICNPPFFENDLKSGDRNKNLAKHHDGLTLKELLDSIKNNLAYHGNFSVLLPFHRMTYFKELANENHFYLKEELLVRQTPAHSPFRALLLYGTNDAPYVSNELIIKDENGKYTEAFDFLLKDYYL